jgi:sporulation protein YlmC with PRC-barrel domain
MRVGKQHMEEDMLTKKLALAFLGTALISAPAAAQTQPQSQTQPSGSTAPSSDQMSTGNWMTQEQPGQWRASKLEGLDVYNSNNEKIGDISELIVDGSGKIQAVVIGIGGFLGIGERDVAVPFDQIKMVTEPRATASTGAGTTGAPGTTGAGGTMGTAGTTAPAGTPSGAATAPANPNAPGTTTGSVATAPADNNMNRSAPDHAMLTMNMTKDQLKAAPEFRYAR